MTKVLFPLPTPVRFRQLQTTLVLSEPWTEHLMSETSGVRPYYSLLPHPPSRPRLRNVSPGSFLFPSTSFLRVGKFDGRSPDILDPTPFLPPSKPLWTPGPSTFSSSYSVVPPFRLTQAPGVFTQTPVKRRRRLLIPRLVQDDSFYSTLVNVSEIRHDSTIYVRR